MTDSEPWLPLARWLARRFRPAGLLETGDLEAIGMMAAHVACQTYDPTRAQLNTWVTNRVLWAVRDAIRSELRMRSESYGSPTSPDHAISLEALIDGDVVDRSPGPDARAISSATVRWALGAVTARQREVLSPWLGGESLSCIASRLGITESGAIYLERAAIGRLKRNGAEEALRG
ncbi:MAG TPA: hypothetical protein VGM37_01460 [Armatimonadota bacterium]|jgi:RNA polymerase sigma factor (sigma-70 family)